MSRTKTTAATVTPMHWKTLTTADLPAPAAEADAALTADIQANGIIDPLYVTPQEDGTYRVIDGNRRLAAALAADLESVPVTLRPVIRTQALTAHPGNVRRDLALSREFLANVRQFGIRIPIKITGTTVIDGHRRLAAAVKLSLTHVPIEHDEASEADQFADMITTARHREGLTLAEEAEALFQMHELGATTAQMAAAAGVSQKAAKGMVKVSGTKAVAVQGLDLEQAARLAAIEEADPELFTKIAKQIEEDGFRAHLINQAENMLWRRGEREKQRAKLEAAGARICTLRELSKKAAPVADLDDVERAKDHAKCQGDAWVLESADTASYTRYCTNTLTFGHSTRGTVSPEERKRILTGNSAWDDATDSREQWLTALIARKHTAAERDQFLKIAVEAQLTGDPVPAKKRGVAGRPVLLGQILGIKPPTAEGERVDPAVLSGRYMNAVTTHLEKAAASRRPAFLFADYAACYELEIPRTVWRAAYKPAHIDDLYTFRAHRKQAARYLMTLQQLGYEPTPIEAAVIAGEDYTPSAAPSTAARPAKPTTETPQPAQLPKADEAAE
ncbi:ParB N-terminal domain-containing protein [Streptomyces sp. NPDC047525]|uniref:ParB N-terminal domain-containing protein n=1 Tax=Streptomyces sp. NPDC047525 TaxID=3155264 RepID=UPI0033EA09A4